MDTINLTNKRDLPLTTDLLKAIQDAYAVFENLAVLVRGGVSVVRLSGCTFSGSSVSDGLLLWGARIVPFKGGAVQANIRLVPTVVVHEVGAGSYEHTTWHAEFGTSSTAEYNAAWGSVTGQPWSTLYALTQDLGALTLETRSNIGKCAGEISALTPRMSAVESKNATQDSRLATLEGNNSNRVDDIVSLSSRTTAAETTIAAHINQLSTLESENGSRIAQINGLNLEVSAVKTENSTQALRLNTLEYNTRYIPQVLLTGNVKGDGTLLALRKHPGLDPSTKVSAERKIPGGYRVSWSPLYLGTKHDYMVIVNVDGAWGANIGVRATYKYTTYFDVTFADDTSLNDTSFDFMVISQIVNP